MGVEDEEAYPFLRWEKRIIHAAIDEGVAILGVCLGAQLIASALGSIGLPRPGQGDRLESGLDHTSRSSRFSTGLSAGKRHGVPVAQ